MIISRTPFRISFFGGGTDYPAWYQDHGGAVLSATIDKYCYITCRFLPPFFDYKYRIAWSLLEKVQKIDEIQHPSVRESLRFMETDKGVEVHHDADLPARTGLGSSSSFSVGMLHALHALQGQMTSREALAREAIHVERDRLHEFVGDQDQIAAAHGGLNLIEFRNHESHAVTPVTLEPSVLRGLESRLMLFFTGVVRDSSVLARRQIESIPVNKDTLERMQDMAYEGASVLVERRSCEPEWQHFGELLHEGWMLKSRLAPGISTPAIDETYEAAREAGAVGGKITGAGGGGFLLLFVEPENQPAVRKRLRSLVHVPFKLERLGSQIIFYAPQEQEGHSGNLVTGVQGV